MAKRGIPQVVKDQCKAFMVEHQLPIGQYGILLNLALKSYKNVPVGLREQWTLQEIVEQGL